jgi:DNA-binding protein H-NS
MTDESWLGSIERQSTETLLRWHDAINSEMQKRHAKDRAEARRKIRELAEVHGIDLAKLAPGAAQKRTRVKTKKNPEKYRNPYDQFKTWSGIGRKPKWVEEWLAAGKPLEDLRIK